MQQTKLNNRYYKIFLPSVFIVLLSIIFSCDSTETVEVIQSGEPIPGDQTNWTFLFYDDADFNNAFDPLPVFAGSMKSGPNLNVIVLQDREDGPARIVRVDENNQIVPIKEMGELNMGDGNTLYEFIKFAKDSLPADRYMFSFYNHGGAWMGTCTDKSSNQMLTMDAIKEAFTLAGGIDVTLFSAPCLMGSLESAYELRECTDIYVASEAVSGYCFWFDVMGSISYKLNNYPAISNIDVGNFIIEEIWNINSSDSCYCSRGTSYLTMSSVRTDKLQDIIDSINELCTYLMSDSVDAKYIIDACKSNFEYYAGFSIDLLSFIQNLLNNDNVDESLKSLLNDVNDKLNKAITASCHGTEFNYGKGLSIFFHESDIPSYLKYYVGSQYGLDMVDNSLWDDLLKELYGSSIVVANENINPQLFYVRELNDIIE